MKETYSSHSLPLEIKPFTLVGSGNRSDFIKTKQKDISENFIMNLKVIEFVNDNIQGADNKLGQFLDQCI
jgi:hypothetical protein